MTLGQQLRFAPRLMWREWKSGEFTVLLLALIVAIASHTAIGHFSDRISRAMVTNANKLIGGDLVFSSPRPISAEVSEESARLGLQSADTQRFMTVASASDEIVLVSVKSVSPEYPLKGAVRITEELFGTEQTVTSGPSRGNIWVEARVLQMLQLELGDKIQIGDSTFTANRILTYEPDRGNNFYSFNPRVMIAKEDLAATNIVQPGSRVWYRQMFAGDSDAVESMVDWLEDHSEPGQRIRNLDEDRPAVSEALSKAKQYMGLASLLALLLAAVAIANSGRHYSERHYETSALLRCLGAQQNDILRIYLIQLCLLALIGGILGNIAGWAAQAGLFLIISDLLPENLPSVALLPALSGMALSFIVLLGFTLPSVLRLKSVSPLRVLRNDLTPYPLSSLLVYGGAAMMVMLLMWFYTGNITLTVSILVGSAIVILIAIIGIRLLFAMISWLLPSFPLRLRAGIRNFLRRKREAVSQTMAFGLTIMAMLVVVFLRTELVTTWQGTIPDDAPNHFVLNIQKDETAAYKEFVESRNIRADQLYPVIRGRLTRVNDKPMVEHVSKEERRHESLSRELNLTWSPDLPPDNKLLQGEWWDGDAAPGEITKVSVEQQLAERLAIGVGDRLTFFTGDRDWEAVVSSVRTVKWDNFNPNFYMVFQPGALSELPTTWINSFYLEPAKKKQLVEMLKQFPSITLLEMDAILNQVKTIITQVTLAIESILLFVLAAGFVVTLSAIQSSMNDRLREGALVRTLGADRKLLKINQWSEFAGMGFLSGLIGVAGAEIIVAQLYQRIFELGYVPTWWAWLLVPLVSALLVGLAGVVSSRRILLQPPMQSLRTLRA